MKAKVKIMLLLFFIGFGVTNAQETVVPIEQKKGLERVPTTTYYFQDVNGVLNKYLGIWKYETSTEIFVITFSLSVHRSTGKNFMDDIVGRFKYIRNGTVIYDTYNVFNRRDIFGVFFKFPNNTNKLNLQYYEQGVTYKTIYAQVNLEFVPSTTLGGSNTLIWTRNIFQDTPTPPPYQLPREMVLVKQ
ncbi:MAG: DUF6705 family protein [Bacteroidota bacterium]